MASYNFLFLMIYYNYDRQKGCEKIICRNRLN
nr:MAG TPA: hypothetical protein [Caudoviricetes sp.]